MSAAGSHGQHVSEQQTLVGGGRNVQGPGVFHWGTGAGCGLLHQGVVSASLNWDRVEVQVNCARIHPHPHPNLATPNPPSPPIRTRAYT